MSKRDGRAPKPLHSQSLIAKAAAREIITANVSMRLANWMAVAKFVTALALILRH